MKEKKNNWQLPFIALLIFLSALFYFIHYLIFHDAHHIFIYLIGDIAFVPFEVLMVTLVLHRLLEAHQKRAMLKKMNMVIGSFFSEVGTRLLNDLSAFCTNISDITPALKLSQKWSSKEFMRARNALKKHSYKMDAFIQSPEALKEFLSKKQHFFLELLGNPNLLEHDQFTDLMWAALHLGEELQARDSLEGLPETDINHISNDMRRAYARLLIQWLDYMEHLKNDYPYLYSLSVRTNPFNPEASVVIAD